MKDIWNADGLGGGRYLRYTIEKSSGAVSTKQLCDVECEFPQWDNRKTGSRHQLAYVAAVKPGDDSFFNAVMKVNVESGNTQLMKFPAGYFASEPMFVSRPGGEAEDDGVLLDVVYNAHSEKSELRVLDAANISHVMAKVILPHHIPHQFHGFFTPELFS